MDEIIGTFEINILEAALDMSIRKNRMPDYDAIALKQWSILTDANDTFLVILPTHYTEQ